MVNPSLSNALFIIPFYNEEARMNPNELERSFKTYTAVTFLLIDDGSTDRTFSLLDTLARANTNVICRKNKQNMGKAESIRQGVLTANLTRYEYIAYLDADLATPIAEVIKLLDYALKNPEKNMIMGARIKLLGNKVRRSLVRHYFGRIFATMVSQFILKVPVYDTQCGAKVMKASIAQNLFYEAFYTKWLFDVEVLLRLQKKSVDLSKKVTEIPLYEWIEKGNSKIKWYEFITVPFQILKLYVKY